MNYFEKANNYYNTSQYEKAIDMYKKAYSISNEQPMVLYNTAVCYIKLMDYKKASVFLKEAIKLNNNSKYYFNLGFCYFKLNNYKKALQNFNIAWSLDNDDIECEKAINLILAKYKKISQ